MGRKVTPHRALTVPSELRSPRWVSASPSDCKYQLTGSLIPRSPPFERGTQHTTGVARGILAARLSRASRLATPMITTPLVIDQRSGCHDMKTVPAWFTSTGGYPGVQITTPILDRYRTAKTEPWKEFPYRVNHASPALNRTPRINSRFGALFLLAKLRRLRAPTRTENNQQFIAYQAGPAEQTMHVQVFLQTSASSSRAHLLPRTHAFDTARFPATLIRNVYGFVHRLAKL